MQRVEGANRYGKRAERAGEDGRRQFQQGDVQGLSAGATFQEAWKVFRQNGTGVMDGRIHSMRLLFITTLVSALAISPPVGVTLIAGGAGLLALDPAQSQQPTLVLPAEIGTDLNADLLSARRRPVA